MKAVEGNAGAGEVLVRRMTLRNPFRIERLCWLSRLHRAAFRPRRRMSRRLVGRPAKRLFRLAFRIPALAGRSRFAVNAAGAWRSVWFTPRNTQFGALYMPQNRPIYEPETSALLDALVDDDGVFFDIGANWGYYAVYIASRDGFRGRIEAFEPFPETFRDLSSTVEQAGLADRIGVHGVALSDGDGTASMAVWDGMQSGLARLGRAESDGTARVEVPLKRLDGLGLPAPDVIKIDAEDHEEQVLRGAAALIDRARPTIVFENWLHRDDPALTFGPIDFLVSRGYRFYVPGWRVAGTADVLVPDLPAGDGGVVELAIVPVAREARFFLPSQLNILAVPAEREDALRARFAATGTAA